MDVSVLPQSVEVVGSITVSTLQVEHVIGLAEFRYPGNSEAEQYAGWTHFPAIPKLFGWMAQYGRMPTPDEGVAFLLSNADEGTNTGNLRIVRRAHKLYMDFCRDMHTMGLLQSMSGMFGYVSYHRAFDLSNVDFLATLLSRLGGDEIGIEAAMRWSWPQGIDGDRWMLAKAMRRERRGATKYEGSIYKLTNCHRRYDKAIKGCWLFGKLHMDDLAEEIRADQLEGNEIGIQTSYFK